MTVQSPFKHHWYIFAPNVAWRVTDAPGFAQNVVEPGGPSAMITGVGFVLTFIVTGSDSRDWHPTLLISIKV